ncbi:MAG: hypothetical protein WC533_02380 [Candidatus Pacearchaeota archaeon]
MEREITGHIRENYENDRDRIKKTKTYLVQTAYHLLLKDGFNSTAKSVQRNLYRGKN